MPVIINDFEVLVDGPQPRPDESTAQTQERGSQAPAQLKPADMERLIQYLAARRLRVLAD